MKPYEHILSGILADVTSYPIFIFHYRGVKKIRDPINLDYPNKTVGWVKFWVELEK